jgi:hypothetical protein
MMHQVSLGASTMGMQLIAEEDDESDEDDEDEAGEMQGAEMMRVICKFRRLRRKHKALKHRFKLALKSAQYWKNMCIQLKSSNGEPRRLENIGTLRTNGSRMFHSQLVIPNNLLKSKTLGQR